MDDDFHNMYNISFPFCLFLSLSSRLSGDKSVTLFIWSLQPSVLEKSFFFFLVAINKLFMETFPHNFTLSLFGHK